MKVEKVFRDLVGILSPSGSESRVADYVSRFLQKHGFEVYKDSFGNVVAKRAGYTKDWIAFCAHMDTVKIDKKPQIVFENGVFKSDGQTILGADDKAGVAAMLCSVKKHMPSVYFIFTVQEEVGLLGSKNLDESLLSPKPALCYVLDGEGPPGMVTVAAPWHKRIKVEVYGKPAHAGIEPQKGKNAIVVISSMISSVQWGLLDEETTSNVGKIWGGDAINIVAESAGFEGEIRSLNFAKISLLEKMLKMTFEREAARAGVRAKVEFIEEFPGYSIPEDSEPLQIFKAACRKIGLKVKKVKSRGGSDANILSKSFPSLNIGIGVEGAHSKNEKIALKDLKSLVELVEGLMDVFGEKHSK